ncbi:uncharacterized protein [Petaurus breviceps papuanus]|uniref:uncharacterized protein n=1 Tax=Petaurus breviceps papuanus TaxID=3040969 RepID=UPI0036DE755D
MASRTPEKEECIRGWKLFYPFAEGGISKYSDPARRLAERQALARTRLPYSRYLSRPCACAPGFFIPQRCDWNWDRASLLRSRWFSRELRPGVSRDNPRSLPNGKKRAVNLLGRAVKRKSQPRARDLAHSKAKLRPSRSCGDHRVGLGLAMGRNDNLQPMELGREAVSTVAESDTDSGMGASGGMKSPGCVSRERNVKEAPIFDLRESILEEEERGTPSPEMPQFLALEEVELGESDEREDISVEGEARRQVTLAFVEKDPVVSLQKCSSQRRNKKKRRRLEMEDGKWEKGG